MSEQNLLDQGKSSLLDEVDSVEKITEKTAGKKKILTEVTTIAEEEERIGERINVGSAEELVAKASLSYTTTMMQLERKFAKLSSKGKTRALISILSLPMGQLPVKLKGREEIDCFGLGQRVQSDRFIIMQHAINEQMQKLKKLEEDNQKQKEKTDG